MTIGVLEHANLLARKGRSNATCYQVMDTVRRSACETSRDIEPEESGCTGDDASIQYAKRFETKEPKREHISEDVAGTLMAKATRHQGPNSALFQICKIDREISAHEVLMFVVV